MPIATRVSRCRPRIPCDVVAAPAAAEDRHALPRGMRLVVPVAMRIAWFLGCLVMVSTASAQPAPPDGAPPAEAAPAPVPPPEAAPPVRAAAPPSPELSPPSLTAPVSAGPGATAPASEQAEPERESYGWQIAIADVAATVLLLESDHSRGSANAGLAVYALGGPIVHLAHDQGGRALASVALRVGLPLASAWLWGGHCSSSDDDCDSEGAVAIGVILGVVTAMVIDATALSHPVKATKPAGATWAPQLTATPQRVALGVLARF
jgi:hypothetical protein